MSGNNDMSALAAIANFGLTTYAMKEFYPECLERKKDDTVFQVVGKTALGCVTHPLIALICLIEAGVRGFFALIAKAIHFCMPKDSAASKFMDKYVIIPLTVSTFMCGGIGATVLSTTILNFFSQETRDTFQKSLKNSGNWLGENVLAPFIAAHINGMSQLNLQSN